MQTKPRSFARRIRAQLVLSLVITLGLGTGVAFADNEAESQQRGEADSGRATSGGQVTSHRGDGDVVIHANNYSRGASAEAGEVRGANTSDATTAGPTAGTREVDNDLRALIAPASVEEAAVGGSGRGSARRARLIDQEGDNEVELDQELLLESGDAVAGSQVIGVVTRGDVSITAFNFSRDADAEAGDVVGLNRIEDISVGPRTGGGRGAGSDTSVLATAGSLGPVAPAEVSAEGASTDEVTQLGDNALEWQQTGQIIGGDAVAGASVIGVVAHGNTSIFAANNSANADSAGGDLSLIQTLTGIRVGPEVLRSLIVADTVEGGPEVLAVGPNGPLAASPPVASALLVGEVGEAVLASAGTD